MSTRTKEALATIYGSETPTDDQPQDPAAAARQAELRDLSGRGRRSTKEHDMTTILRETAEAMKLPELRKSLKDLGVAGSSKLNKPDAVAAFVKASKPKSNGSRSGTAEGQTRVPSPIKWSNADGSWTGSSKSANWNGSRYVIKNYLDTTKAKADEIKSALKEAKEKLDAGAKSVKVLDVTIKVYDPDAE